MRARLPRAKEHGKYFLTVSSAREVSGVCRSRGGRLGVEDCFEVWESYSELLRVAILDNRICFLYVSWQLSLRSGSHDERY